MINTISEFIFIVINITHDTNVKIIENIAKFAYKISINEASYIESVKTSKYVQYYLSESVYINLFGHLDFKYLLYNIKRYKNTANDNNVNIIRILQYYPDYIDNYIFKLLKLKYITLNDVCQYYIFPYESTDMLHYIISKKVPKSLFKNAYVIYDINLLLLLPQEKVIKNITKFSKSIILQLLYHNKIDVNTIINTFNNTQIKNLVKHVKDPKFISIIMHTYTLIQYVSKNILINNMYMLPLIIIKRLVINNILTIKDILSHVYFKNIIQSIEFDIIKSQVLKHEVYFNYFTNNIEYLSTLNISFILNHLHILNTNTIQLLITNNIYTNDIIKHCIMNNIQLDIPYHKAINYLKYNINHLYYFHPKIQLQTLINNAMITNIDAFIDRLNKLELLHTINNECNINNNIFAKLVNKLTSYYICNICYINHVTYVWDPCGHSTCYSCFKNIEDKHCPFCRQHCIKIIKLI